MLHTIHLNISKTVSSTPISSRSTLAKVLFLTCPLLLLPASGIAGARSQAATSAIYGFGPNRASLPLHVPDAASPVWVDTIAKTLIEGWTEYNPTTCVDINTGSYTVTTMPTYGTLFFDVENGTLANGDCPGVTFPFAVARYTWTNASQAVLQDPFTLTWKSPDGKFTQVNSFTAELAKVTQAKSCWWVCGFAGGALPQTETLTLENPPAGAASFVWTITAGASTLVFSNSTATITTTANTAGVKSLAASQAMKDVSLNVVVQNLTYLFKTTVRAPHQLSRRTDLDTNSGRGANCSVSGTQGWRTQVGYEVDDQFGVNTFTPDNIEAGINEKLGAKSALQPNNWPQPAQGGSNTASGAFVDNLCVTGGGAPAPKPPQTPLTNDLIDTIPQTWFAGSSATPPPNQGCQVQTDTINRYIDHGSHVNITSPTVQPQVVSQESSLLRVAGYPMPVQNVLHLASQSTEIVRGRVLEVRASGTIQKQTGSGLLTFYNKNALFQVDSVLKGKVEANPITVEFLENPEIPALTLEQDEYALLFLTNGPSGAYTFADPQVGKMPITSAGVPSLELAQTTAGKLEAVLLASLSDPNPEIARAALEQMANLEHIQSTQPIRDIATSGPPEFQGLAYIALLRLGDYSLLSQAIRFVEAPAQDLSEQRRQSGVAHAIGDIKSKSVLPALHSLLASPDVDLRRNAARALRAMADPSSAPFFVRALDDTDADVQYDAVMGLAALAGPAPDNAPARDVFDKNPGKYLENSKAWWRTAGQRSYESNH